MKTGRLEKNLNFTPCDPRTMDVLMNRADYIAEDSIDSSNTADSSGQSDRITRREREFQFENQVRERQSSPVRRRFSMPACTGNPYDKNNVSVKNELESFDESFKSMATRSEAGTPATTGEHSNSEFTDP